MTTAIGRLFLKINYFTMPLEISLRWRLNILEKPTKYGKYEVYRAGCEKQHYETWNNTGWAYNNNDITHWRDIIPPSKSEFGEAEQIDFILNLIQKIPADGRGILQPGLNATDFLKKAFEKIKEALIKLKIMPISIIYIIDFFYYF